MRVEWKKRVGFYVQPDLTLGENQGGFQVSTVSTTKIGRNGGLLEAAGRGGRLLSDQ
jgi:hypothetical protein